MLQAISWPSRSCHRIRNSRETSKKTVKHGKHAFSWSEAERLGSNQTRCLALCQATSHSDISHMLISRKDFGDEEAVFDVFFGFPSHFAQPLKPLSAAQAWLQGNLHLFCHFCLVSSGMIPKFGSVLTLDLLGTLLGYVRLI